MPISTLTFSSIFTHFFKTQAFQRIFSTVALQLSFAAKYARMLRATLNPLRRVTIISCRMVLDISSFRAEEGGSPDAMRKLQQDRFKVSGL